jgi:ribosome-associated heat shock protein Hsp15
LTIRIDKWLWCTRIYKTRASANDACSTGRVRLNDETAKPATKVRVGDTISVRRKDRTVIVEVVQLLEKRVGAALAGDAVIDKSPPAPERASRGEMVIDPRVARRDRGSGRPTKRDRREIEKFRNPKKSG